MMARSMARTMTVRKALHRCNSKGFSSLGSTSIGKGTDTISPGLMLIQLEKVTMGLSLSI
jgi:hypothetical protein